jgi:hypothetical protein
MLIESLFSKLKRRTVEQKIDLTKVLAEHDIENKG